MFIGHIYYRRILRLMALFVLLFLFPYHLSFGCDFEDTQSCPEMIVTTYCIQCIQFTEVIMEEYQQGIAQNSDGTSYDPSTL